LSCFIVDGDKEDASRNENVVNLSIQDSNNNTVR